MPSIRQIEYLVALAETHHFRKAAEKTGVSQPTLSAQLSALEERLGVQLVERSRSSVMLTPVGEQILAVGKRILRDTTEIRDIAASQKGDLSGSVRLGLPPTIGPYLLPLILPNLHSTHPDLKLYVREQMPESLPMSLAEGVHDVILTPLPVSQAELDSQAIFREPLFVVLPEDHKLAAKGYVEKSDLAGEQVLSLESGYQLHDQVNVLCEEFGADLSFEYEGTSLDTLQQMIAMGMGISLMPGLFVHAVLPRVSGVVALELKGRSLSRVIGIAWRKSSNRTSEFEILKNYVRDAIADNFEGFALL